MQRVINWGLVISINITPRFEADYHIGLLTTSADFRRESESLGEEGGGILHESQK